MKMNFDIPCGYEFVCGIETHVEMKTNTKLFCSCENLSVKGKGPNTRCCPVCLGMSGTLPSLNKKAVEFAIIAGIALDCKINQRSRMARKNYFYPDLTKGYQITQGAKPIAEHGRCELSDGRYVNIKRIHIEEDAGKIIYAKDKMLIDYNRSGVPLLEIVSEPELKSLADVKEYLEMLRLMMIYAGVSDCRLQDGQMRFDVNVSVRRKGDSNFGSKIEIKNINSIHFVLQAIRSESERQARILQAGKMIVSETRSFDEKTGKTKLMRKKENQSDYRYFSDPDVPYIVVDDYTVECLKGKISKMPQEKYRIFTVQYGVNRQQAKTILRYKKMCDIFEGAVRYTEKHKSVLAKLIVNYVWPAIKENVLVETLFNEVLYRFLGKIADLLGEGRITSHDAKVYLIDAVDGEFCDLTDLISDSVKTDRIKSVCDRVLNEYPNIVQDVRAGKSRAIDYLVGQTMHKINSRVNPVQIKKYIKDKLSKY